jgi:tripartite-type tricarboxylate transporter receptor subunit TctC
MPIKNSYKYLILLFFISFGSTAIAQKPPQQAYPTKSIRVIIPGTTGDTCDTMLRLIGHKFMEKTGYSFVMDNRPGAVGQIGLSYIAQAPADGYTIGCGQGGNMVIVPLAYKKIAYDSNKDFAPISLMVSNYLALAVHANSPHKTARELIGFAKANPNKVSFGTNGEGAFLHFATELLRKEAGFTYFHVPFKNAGLIVTDLIGQRIDAVLGAFITVQPHAVSGRLRILGVARETRAPNYPQFPTLSEAGVPGFTSGGWFGAIGPAGMPQPIVAFLNKEMNAAMSTPDVREKASILGLDLHIEPPAFFAKTIRDDFDKWGRLAREINFKPQ